MDLSELVHIIRRYWVVAFASFLAVSIVGAAAAFLPANRYEATATLLGQPNPNQLQFSSVQAVQFVLPGLAKQVESPSFTEDVRKGLPVALRNADTGVTSTADPGSGVVRITVESTSQNAAAPAANALAAKLIVNNPSSDLLKLTVIDKARRPTAPSSPVRLPILLGTFVLALIAALFAAIVTNALRRRFDRASEIRSRFGEAVLGEIPSLPRLRRAGISSAEVFGSEAQVTVAEAFYRLRTNVELALVNSDIHALTVTSSAVGEGKTTVTAHLGWALASVGHDVVLIDSDLRRPGLHGLLGQPGSPGVSDAIVGDGSRLIRATEQPTLGFVPAGVPDRHPAEVVDIALPRLLAQCEAPNRLIIVDSPPLHGAAETSLIAAATKQVILVVDARRNEPDEIERALRQIRQSGAQVLGVVINRARRDRHQKTTEQYYFAPKRTLPNAAPPNVNRRIDEVANEMRTQRAPGDRAGNGATVARPAASQSPTTTVED